MYESIIINVFVEIFNRHQIKVALNAVWIDTIPRQPSINIH